MPISMLFWFLFIIWILFGGWAYQPDATRGWRPLGSHILLCILIFLLGWHVFGFVIKG